MAFDIQRSTINITSPSLALRASIDRESCKIIKIFQDNSLASAFAGLMKTPEAQKAYRQAENIDDVDLVNRA